MTLKAQDTAYLEGLKYVRTQTVPRSLEKYLGYCPDCNTYPDPCSPEDHIFISTAHGRFILAIACAGYRCL